MRLVSSGLRRGGGFHGGFEVSGVVSGWFKGEWGGFKVVHG